MKKLAMTVAIAGVMASGAAHATGVAYTNIQNTYDGLTGATGAYGVYGATMSATTEGAWNTFLDQADDIYTPAGTRTRTIIIGGVPVVFTEIVAASGTHSVNTIVGSAVSAATATTHDFVGSGAALDANSHVGRSVAAITAAANTYVAATTSDSADAANTAGALAAYQTVFNAEFNKINSTGTSLSNLSATFAATNLTRAELADYEVATTDGAFITAEQPNTALVYSSRLNRLAGTYNEVEATWVQHGMPTLTMNVPAGWTIDGYAVDALGVQTVTLNSGNLNIHQDFVVTIPANATTQAERDAAIRAEISRLAGRS